MTLNATPEGESGGMPPSVTTPFLGDSVPISVPLYSDLAISIGKTLQSSTLYPLSCVCTRSPQRGLVKIGVMINQLLKELHHDEQVLHIHDRSRTHRYRRYNARSRDRNAQTYGPSLTLTAQRFAVTTRWPSSSERNRWSSHARTKVNSHSPSPNPQ